MSAAPSIVSEDHGKYDWKPSGVGVSDVRVKVAE